MIKRIILIFALLCASPLLAQQQIPITGGVVTADLSSGVTSFKVNLNQNVTSVVLTGQHPGSGGNTVVCTLFFVQDATGGWTVTFGGNITGGFAVTATPLATTVEQFAFDFTSNTWYAVNAGSAGSSGISGSGTTGFFSQFTGPFSIGNAPMSTIGGVTFSSNPFSVSGPLLFPCQNSASGTTAGLLVTTDSNGNCINLPNGNTAKIEGVCFSGCGTSGTAQIAVLGTTPITFDNQTTINDYVIAGANAQAHDAGATYPTGVQVVGIASAVNSGTGTPANANITILNTLNPSGAIGQTIQVNGTTLAGSLGNLNATTPAAQANNQNLVFQTDNATPTSNVSVEVPLATTGQLGLIQLAQDLCGTDVAPLVCGIQGVPVTFSNKAANDVICFPTSSTIANCKQGVPIRTVASNSDTILSTDRVTDVRYTAASGATAVTLPQAGSTGFANNITMVLTNAQGSGTVTVTPTTSTINGASTLAIPAGNYCFIYSDNTNYFANCGVTSGTSSGPTGSGTANTVTKWTGITALGNSSVTDDGSTPTREPNGNNTAANGNYDEWTVDTGGVTANKLACRSSNNKAQICATSTTTGVLGVALTTQTSGQTVKICWASHCSVVPSNNTTAGHWLIPSTSVAGDVDDTGSTTQPTGTQTFLAESSVTAPAVVATTILSPDAIAASGGGKPNSIQVNGSNNQPVTNFNSTTPSAPANHLNLPFNSSNSGNTTSVTVDPAVSGNASTLATAGTMSGSAGAGVCDDGSKNVTTTGCTGGSVTMSVPVEFLTNGSSSSTSGTQNVTKAAENPNLVWAGPTSSATSNFVQATAAVASSGQSIAVAYPSNNSAGDLLVATALFTCPTHATCNSGGPPTMTDTAGNTWTLGRTVSNAGREFDLWYVCNANSGANTVTLTGSLSPGSNGNVLRISEFSGNATSSCADVGNTANQANGSGSIAVTTSGSVNQSTELVFASYQIANNSNCATIYTITPASNSSQVGVRNNTCDGNSDEYITADATLNQTTGLSGTQMMTASLVPSTSTGGQTVALIQTFKLNTSGAGIPVFRQLVNADLPTHTALNVFTATQTGQTAAITDTTMASAVSPQMYRFSGTINCTASSASATATLNLKWTDTSNTAQTLTGLATCTTLGSSSVNTMVDAIRAKSGTNVTYGVTISNTPTYDVDVRLEQMN